MKGLVYILSVLMMVGMWSCKAPHMVTSETNTTIRVNHRKVPVRIPEVKVSASSQIYIDPDGFPKLGELKVTSSSDKPESKQPKVSASVDEKGNLNIEVVVPEDSTHAEANDSIIEKSEKETVIVEVEKKLAWWQQTLIFIGLLVVIALIAKFAKKYL